MWGRLLDVIKFLFTFLSELVNTRHQIFRLGVSLGCLLFAEDEVWIGKKLYRRKLYVTSNIGNFKAYLQ